MKLETLTSIVTAVGVFVAFLAVWLVIHLRHLDDRKKHFEDIKNKVFKPINQRLERYYIPVLKGQYTNIDMVESTNVTTIISDEDVKNREYRFEFKIKPPEEIPKIISLKEDLLPYSCTKDKHFPKLITEWENFRNTFNAYSNKCVEITEQIEEKIKSKINMPSYTRKNCEKNWIFSDILALFVFQKLMEIPTDILRIQNMKDPITELMFQSYQCARGTPKELNDCKRRVEDLAKDKSGVSSLTKQVKQLESEATKLQDEFEKLSCQTKLPHKCKNA